MIEKKRIAFYPLLSAGHMNVCVSIAKQLLNRFSNVECYFIVDKNFAEKLHKLDARFKFGIIDYDNEEQEFRMSNLVKKYEPFMFQPSLVDRVASFMKLNFDDYLILSELDRRSEEKMKEINPTILMCDQVYYLPSMVKFPCAFIISCNPLILNLEGFPIVGSDAKTYEHEKIKKFETEYEPAKLMMNESLKKIFKLRSTEIPENLSIAKPISEHFSIYAYPKELDYFNNKIKEQYNLWQIDGPLMSERISPKFELPKHFQALPGKVIYVSLGSLFSAYVDKLQKMVDILDKLPHKFIVSKGPNGDKLKFPSNKFVGENYVNQLAVLQVCDLMIAHGGNNTFGECFYFGVPQIIFPVFYDQFSNASRVVETGYGFSLDLFNYTEQQLIETVQKAIIDKELKSRLLKISERIKNDDKLNEVADGIMNYVDKL